MTRPAAPTPAATRAALLLLAAAAAAQPPEAAPPPQRIEPMPVPRAIAVHLGQRAITIDGNLEDWPAVAPLLLVDPRQVSGSAFGAYRGPDDLSAQAFLAWTDDDVYLAVSVRDDWHRPLGARVYGSSEIPPADSVVFSFDPERNTRAAGRDLGRSEDREVWLAEMEDESRELVVLWDRFGGTGARWAKGARMATARDEAAKITTYEARVPWSELLPAEVKAQPGTVIDLDVVVSDLDEVTDVMPQTRIGWTFGTGPRIDPGLHGALMLLGERALEEGVPPFPLPPVIHEPPVPDRRHFVELTRALRRHPAVVFDGRAGDSRASLAAERYRLLAQLDEQLAQFPRVDFLELQMRVHRRMRREVAGYLATGLPSMWEHQLDTDVRAFVQGAAPARGVAILRLPQSGFVVRGERMTMAFDPAGPGVDQVLDDVLDFAVLTRPLELARRNDQLLVRLVAAGKPFLTHIGFHLPAIDAGSVNLTLPGAGYEHAGLTVTCLATRHPEGAVSNDSGYRLVAADGVDLLHLAADTSAPADCRGAIVLLSALHKDAIAQARACAPRLVVLDDVLQCAADPGVGRVGLEQALDLMDALRPIPSVLLAPGESMVVDRP